MSGRSRALRDGLGLAGLLFAAYLFIVVAPQAGTVGFDAFPYWAVNLEHPYERSAGEFGAFPYSPVAARLFAPASLLSWPAFWFLWTAILVATIVWLGWRQALLVLAFPPVAVELYHGNIHLLLAAAVALGLRYPWTWAFVLLTKVTPGIGLIWFAVRREWRQLGVALGVTAVVAAASIAVDARLWGEWITEGLLPVAGSTVSQPNIPIPLIVRLPAAAILVAWGALTDRRWTIPAACALALPILWFSGLSILAAIPALERLREDRSAGNDSAELAKPEALAAAAKAPDAVTAPAGRYVAPHKVPTPPADARLRRMGYWVLVTLAVIGGLLGLGMLWFHLTTDPLADVRAYYDAARRLNAGQPLYAATGDATTPTYYFYPPLLAILMRPFAGLPFHVFAVGWEVVVVASFVTLLRRLGANRRTFIALGLLGMPIGWAIGVAQAHVPMTLLMAIGQPWSIALATNIKLFPILIAVWWLGRRQYQAVGAMVAWLILLAAAQFVLEPDGSIAFFGAVGLDETVGVRNFSPYAIDFWLWAVLGAAGAALALYLAPSRWGWPAAVALATLASPRLLIYMLTGLLAAVREPDPPRGEGPYDRPPPDAAEVFVSSAR